MTAGIDIRELAGDEVRTIGHVSLNAQGEVTIEADRRSTIEFLMHFDCVGRGGRVYDWSNGEGWAEALPRNLRGTHTWAE